MAGPSSQNQDPQYVSFTQLKVWIASQEKYEQANGRPAPLTESQRRALAELVPPPVAPQITDEEAANTNWIGLLNDYITANKSTTPDYKDASFGDAHSLQWRAHFRLPREAPDQWFPPDVLGRRQYESSGITSNGTGSRPRDPSFPKKKDAKQYAARCAVEWLMAHHFMPKDASTARFERETTPLINSVEQPHVSNVYSPVASPRASPEASPRRVSQPAEETRAAGPTGRIAVNTVTPPAPTCASEPSTPPSTRHQHRAPSPSPTAVHQAKKRATGAAEAAYEDRSAPGDGEVTTQPAVQPFTPRTVRTVKSMASPYKANQVTANGVKEEAAAEPSIADTGGVAISRSSTSASVMEDYMAKVNGNGTGIRNRIGSGNGSTAANGESHTKKVAQPDPSGDYIPFEDSHEGASSSDSSGDSGGENDVDIKSSPNVMVLLTLCKTLNLGLVKYKLISGESETGKLYSGCLKIRRPNGSQFPMPSAVTELKTPEATKVAAREKLAKSVVAFLQARFVD